VSAPSVCKHGTATPATTLTGSAAEHHSCESLLHVHVGRHQPGPPPFLSGGSVEDGPSTTDSFSGFSCWFGRIPNPLGVCRRRPDEGFPTTGGDGVSKLVELDAEDPLQFRFAPNAQELFVEWLAELESEDSRRRTARCSHFAFEQVPKLMPGLRCFLNWRTGPQNGVLKVL